MELIKRMKTEEFTLENMKQNTILSAFRVIYEDIEDRDNEGNPFLLTLILQNKKTGQYYMEQAESDMDSWLDIRETYISETDIRALQQVKV
jgi:hypothetical protein